MKWQSNINPISGTVTGNSAVGFIGPFVNYVTNLPLGTSSSPTSTPAGNTFRTASQVVLGSVYGEQVPA